MTDRTDYVALAEAHLADGADAHSSPEAAHQMQANLDLARACIHQAHLELQRLRALFARREDALDKWYDDQSRMRQALDSTLRETEQAT